MSELLAAEGRLICLEFPSAKDPKLPGPPWALPPPVYVKHLSHPGEDVEYDSQTGSVKDVPSKPKAANGLSRIAHWQPVRTHKIGEGTDWVSVWRH